MPDAELRKNIQLPVRRSRTGNGWETVTEFCRLGGCDLDVFAFQSKREALLFSAILKTIGCQALHNASCPTCSQKYTFEKLEGGKEPYDC